MSRLLPHPLLSLMLLVIWLLLANEVSVGQIIIGMILAWSVPIYTARFWPDEVKVRRPLTLLRLIGTVLIDIAVANIAVARLVVRNPDRVRPAFIEMPIRLRTEVGVSMLTSTISLTPGTVSAYLSADHRTLIIHSLDTGDPAALIEAIRDRYETPLMEVLESCSK